MKTKQYLFTYLFSLEYETKEALSKYLDLAGKTIKNISVFDKQHVTIIVTIEIIALHTDH